MNEKSWLDEKLEDPAFRAEFEKARSEVAETECRLANEEVDTLRAALATARDERDEARRWYCREVRDDEDGLCGCGCRGQLHESRGSEREVCERLWPDDADRLFPSKDGR